jgi:phenylalanyl-tRNA synthetase beta chain
MKFSYLWLSELVKKIPQPEKLAGLLTMQFMHVEEIKKVDRDFVFDIDVLPNRMPDASGHIGIAREICALTGAELSLPAVSIKESNALISKFVSAHASSEGVARYVLAVVSGITVGQSPKYIRERLEACGLRPINNIVDATNYIMLETGHPAHAFDYDKLAGHNITVRFARPAEPFEALDGAHFKLGSRQLIIADAAGPLALAGIKGGRRTEIDASTKCIVLELGVFDRALIRQTSRALNLTTDASLRFSRGISPHGLDGVMKRLCGLIQEVAGGKVAKGIIDIKKNMRAVSPILVRQERVINLLGKEIPIAEIVEFLSRLSFAITSKGKGVFVVTPPLWRLDIDCEADVIEEVGRLYGYDNIKAAPPHAALLHPEENDAHMLADKMRESFRAFGFFEVENYSFESQRRETSSTRLELLNPVSEEFMYLRTSLLAGLLENIRANSHNAKELRLYELGNVFRKGRRGPEEQLHFCAALAGSAKPDALYFEAKGIAESLFERFGIADVWFENIGSHEVSWPCAEKVFLHPYRAAFIKSNSEILGMLYQIHPEEGAKVPVVAIEILMPAFIKKVEREFEFQPIPRFPAVMRDISVLVPRVEQAEDVTRVIEKAGGELLADSDLFDYYEGDAVGQDQKSLAFRLIFQSRDRTLKDKEIATCMDAIIEAIRREGWEARV